MVVAVSWLCHLRLRHTGVPVEWHLVSGHSVRNAVYLTCHQSRGPVATTPTFLRTHYLKNSTDKQNYLAIVGGELAQDLL